MTDYSYKVIRTDRKTVSLEISDDLNIIIRAPLNMSDKDVDSFVKKHAVWISKHIDKIKNRRHYVNDVADNVEEIKQSAREYLPQRTAYFGRLMGLKPTSIKITSAKKRFGSCNSKNGICFSYLLMRYPNDAIDYVIVHELAHIKYKNHGKAFYELIKKYLPDYADRIKMLKEY
ncbi:MAG: SprT family zinc-dependent metalloprotease [Eubacteriales bacterium]|nr:SprT family zinc-dependent metalloprotease [Eubacteriales bacterium]MDD4421798.1 SprT family zinc-dependent metalloprotease [Eubacteriales bacterium]HBR31986.1 M48 family peptidase [Clostridiales bacterium]